MAPRAGFEPATNRLTAGCSTTELPGNTADAHGTGPITKLNCFAKHEGGRPLWAFQRSLMWRPGRGGKCPGFARRSVSEGGWRPRPESNRRARICSPLRNHSATWPLDIDPLQRSRPFFRPWLYRRAARSTTAARSVSRRSGHRFAARKRDQPRGAFPGEVGTGSPSGNATNQRIGYIRRLRQRASLWTRPLGLRFGRPCRRKARVSSAQNVPQRPL